MALTDKCVGLSGAVNRELARVLSPAQLDAYEKRDLAFHERLRGGYAAIAKGEPQRCALIDGARPAEEIAADVWAHVQRRLLAGPR